MKIAVVGPGAMGCTFGGILTEIGEDVTLVGASSATVDALNERGLRLEGIGGDRVVRVKATTNSEQVGEVDLVIFVVKAHDTEAAAGRARPLVGEHTVVLTLQNGLGHVPRLARILGEDRVIQGVSRGGSTVLGPAHVAYTCPALNHIGELDSRITDRIRRLADILNRAGFETVVTDRIQTEVWGKLLLNVAVNPVCAVSGLMDKELLAVPEAWSLSVHLITEAAAVAAAQRIELPYDDPVATLRDYVDAPIPGKPSTLQDLEKGRRTEIDALNGAIVAEGERLGIPTPYNAAITYMVKMIEQRQRLHATPRF